ncbi:Hsp20/alpha crystallin family protein [Natrarchaeobius halalkaliphilus]|uniref:Hsp20/alpha crystallin family protein n=1 Tax=Natrarchaeobius halalkaliphilus TaxID=1679091 RepID=A0A3N6NYL6_9EURY|nr:Hsp20/alpha crystallin family protein [Natrarchaeobius halalkaliphilus]RQG89939.1 Hsp20/alpha crystallin family protein [Natrarchaeobius halalkaliphilus]
MSRRSSPFDGLAELFDKLARQLETAARSWETEIDNRSRLDLSMGREATNLDLTDEGEEFIVTVDVPGYDRDDLDIRLTGETLSITGERERTEEHEAGEEMYIRRERELQSFNRHVRLPDPVDVDDVSATVNNGILTIKLPKLEFEGESHSINVE